MTSSTANRSESGPGALPERPAIRLSAIVPNYNHGRLVEAAISALLAQTRPPDEVVVVDDGSTDQSRDIVSRLAAADSRVRLIVHEHNRGAIAALNTGIGAATGTHVYLGAADDLSLPHLLADLTAVLESNPGLGLYSGEVRRVDRDSGRVAIRPATRPSHAIRTFTPDETANLLRRIDNFILTGAALIDRERLLEAGGLRAELGSFADGYAARQLALRHGFAFVPRVLAEWHVAGQGYSRRTAADPEAVLHILAAARAAFARDPAFPAFYPALFERRWKFGVLRLAAGDLASQPRLVSTVAPAGLQRTLSLLAPVPVFGRLLAYAALFAAFRPFALSSVIGTALRRGLEAAVGAQSS